ncbi:hypothetical protein WJX77_011579 [Trebouxia sp. C0004]
MSAPSLYFSILEVVYLMYQAYYWLPVILLSLTAAAAVSLMVTLRRQQLKRGKAMCDMVLLQGACMVVESTLSGEAAQVRKAAFVPEDGVRYDPDRHQSPPPFPPSPLLSPFSPSPLPPLPPPLPPCPHLGLNTQMGSMVRELVTPTTLSARKDTFERLALYTEISTESNSMCFCPRAAVACISVARFHTCVTELAFVNSLPLIDSAFKKAEQDSNVPSTSKAAIGHANVKSTQSTLDQSFAKAPKARRSQILLAPLMLLMGMVMQILGQYAVRIKSLTEIKVPLTRMHSRLVKLQGTGIKKGWVDDPAVSGPTLREVWGSLDTLNDDLFHWLQKLLELILAGHSAERAFAKDIANCS